MTRNRKEPQSQRRRLRVATYNIHKCRGMDGRVRPDRIAEVLREIDADIIALQEVLSREEVGHKHDHAGYVAEELGYYSELGRTRDHKGADYGNLLLTRFPIQTTQNYDITALGRERRGCFRADLHLEDGGLLHVFNVHMGTAFFERRKQARKLMDGRILTNDDLTGARLVLGDFNEWTHGLASRLLRSHFRVADPRAHLGRTRTYPGFLPLLHLDHIYFDPALKLESLALHRSRTALVASDHLPLVADFSLPASS